MQTHGADRLHILPGVGCTPPDASPLARVTNACQSLAMRVLVFLFLILAACGRPLTPSEAAFARDIHGTEIDTSRVRLFNGALVGNVTHKRPKRPRLACRERLSPEPQTEFITTAPSSVVIHNKVFFARSWYQPDFMRGYPDQLNLGNAMLLAHEITHVWQWQNRRATGYSPLRAITEHQGSNDPYLFDISTDADLMDFGYEQQASIVEEYVCCATLDPDAPRTRRLADMLRGAFPLGQLPRPRDITLPWDGAQAAGICRI